MLFYPAALPLSRQTLTHVTGILRRHRRQICSPWRILRKLRCCPLAGRATGQGDPRSSSPRDRRMKKVHWGWHQRGTNRRG